MGGWCGSVTYLHLFRANLLGLIDRDFMLIITRNKSRFILLFLLLCFQAGLSCQIASMNDLIKAYPPKTKTLPAASSSNYFFRLYDEFISPIDGDRCQMSPSCSNYSRQAIDKRGIVAGLLMTLDRLQRCGNDLSRYPRVYQNNLERYFDPVSSSKCEGSKVP